jgi:hypothetical protein
VNYTFYLPPLPAGWYEARPYLVQEVKGNSISTNLVASTPVFPLRVFATCPSHGYARYGSTDILMAQTPSVGASSIPLQAGLAWPMLRATAGENLTVTLDYGKEAAGQWMMLVWQPEEPGQAGNPMLRLASARVGADGRVTLSWIASPGDGVVTAIGYGTDGASGTGGLNGSYSAGLFELDVHAPPVQIQDVPTGS